MNYLKFAGKILILYCALLEIVSGIVQKHKAKDGKTYLIETDLKYNWYQAFHECARSDYQLVAIDSAAKNEAIISLLKQVIGNPQNLWLGGNDEFRSSTKHDRQFFWSATGRKFHLNYWSGDNPDNYQLQEHCVHIWANHPDFRWNDNLCTYTFGFICEETRFPEKYQNELKNKYADFKQITSAIIHEFNMTRQQQLSEIDLKLKIMYSLQENFKIGQQQWQNATHAAVQKVPDKQQDQIDQLSEKIFNF